MLGIAAPKDWTGRLDQALTRSRPVDGVPAPRSPGSVRCSLILVVAGPVAGGSVRAGIPSVSRQRNGYARRIAQAGCEHQNQRGYDPEGQERIERWQDRAKVDLAAARELPSDGACGESRKAGNRARARGHLKACSTLRASDIVRARRGFGS